MANPFEAGRELSKIKQVMAWLDASMAGKECAAAPLEEELQALGYSHGTIHMARKRARIKAVRRADGWVWIPRQIR